MFATPLRQIRSQKGPEVGGQEQGQRYKILNKGYGKDAFKLMYVKRNGSVHSIQEFEMSTHLKLSSSKDYLYGNNADIVDTDAQKNLVYVLAKKHGIEIPEKFALLVARHILSKYSHVEEVHVHMETLPWQRMRMDDSSKLGESNSCPRTSDSSQLHNHAFILQSSAQHFCDVILTRQDSKPTVFTGIKGLRLLKTTKSSFVNFVDDEYRTLPDLPDRTLCTAVDSSWEYSDIETADFSRTWQIVKDVVLKGFAGDPKEGISSTSLQNTMYLSGQQVLDLVPQVSLISFTMLNLHYGKFNTKPFQQLVPGENNEVLEPVDKPFSTVYVQLAR
ncbi:uricase-like [Drosophila novamexicana]|uniref:uricase-like n=1 Tax=Drosophila novamexicana TaxID=47314 RepID=UPI0011E5C0DF|nr:uricase-like [Drosophila novamexicana]